VSRAGRLPPPLDLLVGVLPTADQTEFLLACLAPAPQAVAAWRRWRACHVPTEWLAGRNARFRGLSALLASSLLGAGAPLDDRDAAWLRVALVHEERRSGAFRAILGEVLAALAADGVPFLLAKGVAVAETVTFRPWLRHSHDVDLLVTPDRVDDAVRTLCRAGLREGPAQTATRWLVHPNGLPVFLHTRPIGPPLPGPAVEALVSRADRASVLGVTVSVPAADDMLLHVCGHAVTNASRRTGRWVCDAHEIVRGRPGLDWPRLLATATTTGLAVPLAATLGYLADAIGTPVPPTIREALGQAIRDATGLERELLVHAARMEGTVPFLSQWAAAGTRSRVTLLRWALAPDARYLRWLGGDSSRSALAIQAERLRRGWHRLGLAWARGR
jgi:hypothetical protein